jgi:outer membrane protein TolC
MKRLALVATLLATACTVGPNYQRPAVAVPETFSKAAAPGAADAALASWWSGFGDAELDS